MIDQKNDEISEWMQVIKKESEALKSAHEKNRSNLCVIDENDHIVTKCG